MVKSIPTFGLLQSCVATGLFFVVGMLLVLIIAGGRELKVHGWSQEEATVLNTFSKCRMVYGAPEIRDKPRYIKTINCEDVETYVAQHQEKYDHLRPEEVKYISLGYAPLGLNSKTVKLEAISESDELMAGQQVEILVHPKDPRRINRLPVAGELISNISELMKLTIFTFFAIWSRSKWLGTIDRRFDSARRRNQTNSTA